MTRTELCARVVAATSLSKADVAAAARAVFSTIADAVARGETVAIASSRAPAFKAGKALRDAVNE